MREGDIVGHDGSLLRNYYGPGLVPKGVGTGSATLEVASSMYTSTV